MQNLFLGRGRLVQACQKRPYFKNWLTLSQHQVQSDFRGDLASFTQKDLPICQNVIFALAPAERDIGSYQAIYLERLEHALRVCSYQRFIFCSSTVVYNYSQNQKIFTSELEGLDFNSDQSYRRQILRAAEKLIDRYAFSRGIIVRFSGLSSGAALAPQGNRILLSAAAYYLEQMIRLPLEHPKIPVLHLSQPHLSSVDGLEKPKIYPLLAHSFVKAPREEDYYD